MIVPFEQVGGAVTVMMTDRVTGVVPCTPLQVIEYVLDAAVRAPVFQFEYDVGMATLPVHGPVAEQLAVFVEL